MSDSDVDTRIFGFTEDADAGIVTLAFVVIVLYLVVSQHFLTKLNAVAKNTCYCDMIQHLYKDLTITGLLSFVLAMLLGTESLKASKHVIYMEIAEITLFFSTLYHVLFSLILIFTNANYLNALQTSLSIDSVDLINLCKQKSPFEMSVWCFWTSKLRGDLELRVFRIVFHSYYSLARTFDFAKYLALCQEVNILNLLEVHPAHWASFFLILGVNYIWGSYSSGDGRDLTFIDNYFCSNSRNENCTNATMQVILFCVVIVFHIFAAACLAYTSRYCELNILAASGPTQFSEFYTYVLKDERVDLEKTDTMERMSWKDLKNHIELLKVSDPEEENETLLDLITRKLSDGAKVIWSSSRDLMKGLDKQTASVHSYGYSSGTITIADEPSVDNNGGSISSFVLNRESENGTQKNITSSNHRVSIISAPSFSLEKTFESDRETAPSSESTKSNKSSKLYTSLRHTERKLNIFPFNSPKLYYFFRGSTNWSFCVMLGFYTTAFWVICLHTEAPVMWNFIISCLLIVCGSFLIYTVRSSSFIYAFSKLDTDVIGRIIEEKEERSELERKLRKKLCTKLQNAVGEKHKETKLAVMQLFAEIKNLSNTSDGFISKSELRLLLVKLNIHFSNDRFDEAFQMFDLNSDGRIGLKELYDFIYPDPANKKKRELRKKKYRATVGTSLKCFSNKERNKSNTLPEYTNPKGKAGQRRASVTANSTVGLVAGSPLPEIRNAPVDILSMEGKANRESSFSSVTSSEKAAGGESLKRKQPSVRLANGKVADNILEFSVINSVKNENDNDSYSLMKPVEHTESEQEAHGMSSCSTQLYGRSGDCPADTVTGSSDNRTTSIELHRLSPLCRKEGSQELFIL